MKKTILFLMVLAMFAGSTIMAQNVHPKREFRGAWMPTVTNNYKGMPTEKIKAKIINELDTMQMAGINAVLFQVRPEADALYPSELEPWSRFISGEQGKAPDPYWDPTQFVIDECHKRGMEFHAWINPYRVKANLKNELAPTHLYYKHPEYFITYGNLMLFNPSLQESRDFICKVVADMISRYDMDAIHMDDYFYPYPVEGEEFPDEADYQRLGKKDFPDKADWRRHNVNVLIKQIHETVRSVKPWVKFGVSPFGVYRNKSEWPLGSETNALTNYHGLYADVLLWAREGWIDYNIPQLYWEVGHPRADYKILTEWWAKNAENRPMIVGQSLMNSIRYKDPENPNQDQVDLKFRLQREYQTITGSCQWPGGALTRDPGKYFTRLKENYHRYPALMPVFDFMDDEAPGKVRKVKTLWTEDGYMLFWTAPKDKGDEMQRAVQYVIYRFAKGEKVDIEDPSYIVAITRDNFYKLPYEDGKTKYKYVVTALDRLHNESKKVVKSVKL